MECRNISEVSEAARIITGRQSAHGAELWSSTFRLSWVWVFLCDQSAFFCQVKWPSPISHAGPASGLGEAFREAKLPSIFATSICSCLQQAAAHGRLTMSSAADARG